MCGIFGVISTGPDGSAILGRMGRLLRHRGPDGEGYLLVRNDGALTVRGGPDTKPDVYQSATPFTPEGPLTPADAGPLALGLGHRRLAIVELSALGHGPMSSADRSLWITYNGEVYNHVELRRELESLGHSFDSHSDTAVILAAYRQWGVDCLRRFNGMFAFALWDTAKQMLFLARDRFGVKPLNLWSDGKTVMFSSEIKAFLASDAFSVRPDVDLMGSYLASGPSEFLTDTFFKGVRRMPAATYAFAPLSAFVDGSAPFVPWWSLDPNPSKEPFQEKAAADHTAQYLDLLDSAVQLRLRADVKIGSALSGGLDSSSIVYLMAEQLKREGVSQLQETFSSVYPSPGLRHCDESEYIREIGELLGVSMNTIEPQARDVPAEHARMIWALDTPPESTLMSSWHTFLLVHRQGIKVTLDGQGADEQLAGYLNYLPHAVAGRPPLQSLKAARQLLGAFPMKFAAGSIVMGAAPGLIPRGLLRNDRQRGLADRLSGGLNAHLLYDSTHSLANLIHYADRTSMAFSVESRMPFLDYRLAEYLAALPEAYKLHGGWTKYVARRAFDGKLPNDVTWRRDKMGWPIPERVWRDGPLRDWFDTGLGASSAIADYGLGKEFAAAAASRNIDEQIRALNLQAWHTTFADQGWKTYADD